MIDLIQYNKNAWNSYVSNSNRWTIPVTEIDIKNAQNDIWSVILTPSLATPRSWFPEKHEKHQNIWLGLWQRSTRANFNESKC